MKSNLVKFYFFLLLGLGSLFLLNACSEDSDDLPNAPTISEFSIQLREDNQLGLILCDSLGRTLYAFSPDVAGNSTCEGGCLDAWPIFYRENISFASSSNLLASDFGEIIHPNGQKQSTYKGWPLYYYAPNGDGQVEAPGQTLGQGLGGVWYVAKPDYTLFLASKDVNGVNTTYLVDDRGRTLYLFNNDSEGVSNCAGTCAEIWPPFQTENIVLPSPFTPSAYQSIIRADGQAQLTLQGQPLYYYDADQDGISEARGETNGQGVGNVWFIIPKESLIEAPNPSVGY
ncbi:MAG: hypothetical protein AAFU64_05105 [Bacteroidota bacterium]